jgi:probable rRNA maturation factor
MQPQLICASALPDNVTKQFLEDVFRTTLDIARFSPECNISLAFVSQAKIKALNMEFAKNNYPTDVLSFSYPGKAILPSDISGEVVICTSIAKSQAKENNTDLLSEIALLFAHGLIHLAGKDHQTKAQQASFDSLQSAIIESLSLKYRNMPW